MTQESELGYCEGVEGVRYDATGRAIRVGDFVRNFTREEGWGPNDWEGKVSKVVKVEKVYGQVKIWKQYPVQEGLRDPDLLWSDRPDQMRIITEEEYTVELL